MMNDAATRSTTTAKPTTFDEHLRNLELVRVLGNISDEKKQQAERSIWGLALSGGGIRSATFSLGALQALSACRWLSSFHYVSTVSGGGYIGAYLQGMIHRYGLNKTIENLSPPPRDDTGRAAAAGATAPGATSQAVLDLRRFSNFLSPDNAALSADRVTIVSTYLSNMVLTQIQLVSLLLLIAFLPLLLHVSVAKLAYHPVAIWGIALISMLLAMGARQHVHAGRYIAPSEHRRRQTDSPSTTSTTQEVPALLKYSPPALLAASIMLMSMMLAKAVVCRTSEDDVCNLWTPLFGLEYPVAVGSFELNLHASAPELGVGLIYLIGFIVWMRWWWREARAHHLPRLGQALAKQISFGILASAGVVVAAHAVASAVMSLAEPSDLWMAFAVGTPALFAAIFGVSLMHVGLAFTKDDCVARERWARLMGRCALWVLCAIVLPTWMLFGMPWIFEQPASQQTNEVGVALPVLWISVVAFGAVVAYRDQSDTTERRPTPLSRLGKLIIASAPWAFVAGMFALVFWAVWKLVFVFVPPDPRPPAGTNFLDFANYASALNTKLNNLDAGELSQLSILLLTIGAVWILFALRIDENEFSMNGFYRNRLVRCYLGPSNPQRQGDPETDLDPTGDDLALAELLDPAADEEIDEGRPLYPLISAAVNLLATKELDWQNRKAASFVMSPLFCGHLALDRPEARAIGDVPSDLSDWHNDLKPSSLRPSPLSRELTLGTAMSISGAAVSPNMGYHSSPAVTFLLTLFNARLGWWVRNYNATKDARDFPGLNLISEMLSQTTDRGYHAYISDGGHFENLGIYELVRRKCRFILSIDSSADPDRDFAGLGNAIHKCRVDFGAEIDIDVSLMRPDNSTGISQRCAALGKLTYSDGSVGTLLYIKPSLIGNEPPDIAHYASAHREFPHEPTTDQFFDEQQFESYRQLGYVSCMRVLGPAMERLTTSDWNFQQLRRHLRESACEIDISDNVSKEQLLLELTYCLFEPSNAVSLHFSRHGERLSRLLGSLREDPALASLDDQLNPGWSQINPNSEVKYIRQQCFRHLELPPENQFRSCFYFMQELIQLMEAVYIDLDLEQNFNHPDNRGWMNLFRHWVWVPMFRLTWSLSAQTRGSRFVRFCETRLDVPRFVDTLFLSDWYNSSQILRTQTLPGLAKALMRKRKISFIERSILESETLQRRCQDSPWSLAILHAGWDRMLGTSGNQPRPFKPLNLGIALLVGTPDSRTPPGPSFHPDTLILMRVQDHVRRLGIGAEFMRQIVHKQSRLEKVEITPGDYGTMIGKLGNNAARRQCDELTEMLAQARMRRKADIPGPL